jgi:histidinol-phosphate aminotransferase
LSSFLSSSEAHGGQNIIELREYGIDPAQLIDFSVNSNPFGPAPSVIERVLKVDISKYPDPQTYLLSSKLAEMCQVEKSQVLVGNGSSELIGLIARAYLKPGDQVVILEPTFSEYRRSAEALGAVVKEVRALAPAFKPPLEAFLKLIERTRPQLVFVCNPNNPTGILLSPAEIAKISEACGDNSLLIIDEAYQSFSHGVCFSTITHENTLLIRSMTKDFALAGLRLGYAVGQTELIAKLRNLQPTWSVNAFAQEAGLAAIEDLRYYKNCFKQLHAMKETFFHSLRSIGVSINHSATHYGVFTNENTARSVRQNLLRQGIQVRDCSSFGLPYHIRISTQLDVYNQVLLEALTRLAKDNQR